MKKLLRILIVLVVLVVVAAVVAVFAIDSLAKSGLETAASYALDVDTTVEDLSLSLIGGRLEMDGLRIANPPGFSSEHLMKSGQFALQLKTATLFSDPAEAENVCWSTAVGFVIC